MKMIKKNIICLICIVMPTTTLQNLKLKFNFCILIASNMSLQHAHGKQEFCLIHR